MWGVKLELEVARQMYELAVRREENRLTAKDKEILGMIEIPNSQTLKIIYRISLERSDALNTLNDFIAGRKLPRIESAMHFLEMYYDQKENGMTHEIETKTLSPFARLTRLLAFQIIGARILVSNKD